MTARARLFRPLLTVAVLGIAAVAAWHYWPRETPISYRTAALDMGPVVREVSAVGTLQPVRKIDVGSQVSGQVKELLVDFNSVVKKDDVLARLNPVQVQAKIQQIEAELKTARAQHASAQAELGKAEVVAKDAERNYQRAKNLYGQKLLSESDVDAAALKVEQTRADIKTRRAGVQVAEAAIAQREAALKDQQTNLEYTIIRAPVSGTVIQRNVNIGQTLAANFQAPVLFVIAEDLKVMQLEAGVDEADIGAVEVDQPVTFTVDAFPDRKFDGLVRDIRLVPTTTQNVVSYTVIIDVDNSEQQLLPGMTASVRIETANVENVLRVPNAALRFTPPADVLEAARLRMVERMQAMRAEREAQAAKSGGEAGAENRNGENRNGDSTRGTERRSTDNRGDMPAGGFAGGGQNAQGGGIFGGQPGGARALPRTRVFLLNDDGSLDIMAFRAGVSDEQYTQVLRGRLEAGQKVVIGREEPKAK